MKKLYRKNYILWDKIPKLEVALFDYSSLSTSVFEFDGSIVGSSVLVMIPVWEKGGRHWWKLRIDHWRLPLQSDCYWLTDASGHRIGMVKRDPINRNRVQIADRAGTRMSYASQAHSTPHTPITISTVRTTNGWEPSSGMPCIQIDIGSSTSGGQTGTIKRAPLNPH